MGPDAFEGASRLTRAEKRFSFDWALGISVMVGNCFLISGKALHAEDDKDNPFFSLVFCVYFFKPEKQPVHGAVATSDRSHTNSAEMEILCLGEIYSESDPKFFALSSSPSGYRVELQKSAFFRDSFYATRKEKSGRKRLTPR